MRSTARKRLLVPAVLLCSSNCCQHVAAFTTQNYTSVHSLTNIIVSPRRRYPISALSSNTDNTNESSSDEPCNGLTEEMERLQQQLTYIEALEERNKAQLDSFVDEKDQWDSMEEEERQLLQSKGDIEKRLEQMTSELVNMWMGGKSMEG